MYTPSVVYEWMEMNKNCGGDGVGAGNGMDGWMGDGWMDGIKWQI